MSAAFKAGKEVHGLATFDSNSVQTFVVLVPAENHIYQVAFISFANGFIYHTSRRKISIRKANATRERLFSGSDAMQRGITRHTVV